jgi:hypothetical protein
MTHRYLERALAMCDAFSYKAPEVSVARTLLGNIQKADKLIAKAMKAVDYELLRKAVKFCESFNYQSAKAGACSKLYKRVAATRQLLTGAIKAMEQQKLEEAVGQCDEKRFNGKVYRCDLEARARWFLGRVTKINKLAKQAKKECIEDQVRAIVAAADAIGMTTPIISGFRKLIKGPYITFLDEQFACAAKLDDVDRAVLVDVKRKDIVVQQKGAALSLSKFPGLKDAMLWATEKFGGNKEKRAEGMCSFTRERLHSPFTMATAQAMTRGDKVYQKEVKDKTLNVFDTVQKFMRQRNSLKIPMRLDELLKDCVAHDFLRDECYVSIIKQCTNNPDDDPDTKPELKVDAVKQGLELLALCLTVFPPSEAFNDYLEYFLRTGPFPDVMEKYKLRGQLRKTAYLGVDTDDVIDPQHFEQACEYNNRAYVRGALNTVLPERLALETFEPIQYNDKKTAPWLSLKKDAKPPKDTDGVSPRRRGDDDDDNGNGHGDNDDTSSRNGKSNGGGGGSKKSPKHDKKEKASKKKDKKKDKKAKAEPEPEPEPEPERAESDEVGGGCLGGACVMW